MRVPSPFNLEFPFRNLHFEQMAKFKDLAVTPTEIANCLAEYVTPDRQQKIEKVLAQRTYQITVVTEGIYDQGNINAVMRSAEGFGLHDLHIVETGKRYKTANRVASGADKWLDVHRWKDAHLMADSLKSKGYQMVATHLDETAVAIDEIDFTKPTAILFGNEKEGVSPQLLELCEHKMIIPMQGFMQSFNISVAAAVSIYHAVQYRKRVLGQVGDLTENEKAYLKAVFYFRSVRHPRALLSALLTKMKL